ncbi:MAG: DUF1572 family protein [Planctomycetes bacterium]|nr:DUF1572 family protein [Planctomycetota bacterium]
MASPRVDLADPEEAEKARAITVRDVEFTVGEALTRSLSHIAYHVGVSRPLGALAAGPGLEIPLHLPRRLLGLSQVFHR